MRIDVLGALQIEVDGRPVELGARLQRRLVALVVRVSEVVSVDALIDAVWGDAPQASAVKTVHSYVARLRDALAVDRMARRDRRSEAIVTAAPGYRLVAPAEAVDRDEPNEADRLLAEGFELWRGEPYGEFIDGALFAAEARRLTEICFAGPEARLEVGLALGRDAEAVADAQALCTAHPLHEQFWVRLVTGSRANADVMREAPREAKRTRSVRARVVLMTAVVATSLVGCAPDVISVNGASQPPSESEPTLDLTLPSLQPDSTACGADDSVDLSDRLLTLRDVWPTETGRGEAYTNYTLPPDTCTALVDTGVASRASCDYGFPYFAHAELVPALANLGVTEYHAIHLDQVTSQNTVSSTVDETWLKLPPNDMSWLISLVDNCGATVGGDYLVMRSGTSIRLLLRVLGDSAVVLTFDDRSGLSNSWKLKLLDKATTLVAIGR